MGSLWEGPASEQSQAVQHEHLCKNFGLDLWSCDLIMAEYHRFDYAATAPPPYDPGLRYYDGYQQGFGPDYEPSKNGGYDDEETVIQQPPGIIYGPYPVRLTCPYCSTFVQTTTIAGTSPLGWFLGTAMLLLGCIPCAVISCFCVDSLKRVTHRCPQCKSILGTFWPSGV